MKPRSLSILLLAIAILHSSCGDHSSLDTAQSAHQVSPPAYIENDDTPPKSTSATIEVMLDNGRRWKANPETTTGIANMVDILGAYDPASGNPAELQAALEEEFGLIFERCTMEGEAHNQLHNYLLPIHHQLRDFAATEAQRSAMGEHLTAYATYFE